MEVQGSGAEQPRSRCLFSSLIITLLLSKTSLSQSYIFLVLIFHPFPLSLLSKVWSNFPNSASTTALLCTMKHVLSLLCDVILLFHRVNSTLLSVQSDLQYWQLAFHCVD